MDGGSIRLAFFTRVLCRIRNEFGETGKKFRLELTYEHPYPHPVIMYALQELSSKGVVQAIKKLLADKVFSSRMEEPLSFWANRFVGDLRNYVGPAMHEHLLVERKVFEDLYSTWYKLPDTYNVD